MSRVKTRLTPDRRTVTLAFSDTTDCAPEEIRWCDHGVTLHSKWYLRQGAEIELGMEIGHEKHSCHGVVVHCENLQEPGQYLVTLYFLEAPCAEIQHAARSVCGWNR
jgi:hypothetical protein